MPEREMKVSVEEIESDPTFLYFKEKHDLCETTWVGYVNGLQRYVEFTGIGLSKLIEEAEREELERIPLEKRMVGKRLIGYRRYLKGLNLAPASIHRMVAAVKSFYTNGYSIQLPKLGKDRALMGKIKTENKGIPSKEDIVKVLNTADIREKAIILGITSSGLSTNDFLKLTVGDFKGGYDEETGITILDMRRTKTQQDFVTFFSAEATQAFNEYLAWREKQKPKTAHKDILKGWEKHRIYSDDNYLISKKYIPDEYLGSRDEELRKEDEHGLQTLFRLLANRAGIAREKGVWNMFRAHKLRSWFYSTLINSGCPQEYAEVFMGHTSRLGSSNGTYYSIIIPKLKQKYLEFMPHLSLLAPVEVKVIETEGYKELLERNVALEEDLKKRDMELDKVMREIESMKAREAVRESYDQRMTLFMKAVLDNPKIIKLLEEEGVDLKSTTND